MADWLFPLPDGTFPNVKIVIEILTVVDTMPIDCSYLQNNKRLVRAVQAYQKNASNLQQVQDLANKIIDQWNRMVYGISTSYHDFLGRDEDDGDEFGGPHGRKRDPYRDLIEKVEKQR